MLSLAEYQAYANDIDTLGEQTDQQIADTTQDSSTKQDAINRTKALIGPYQRQLKQVLDQAMLQIAQNTYQHYTSATQLKIDENIIKEAIRDQYKNKYYGLNLTQRLVLMKLRLNRIVTQTAQVGKTTEDGVRNLHGTFSNPIPFGAQSNISRRLLQGTAIKLEQDIAKKVAKDIDYPFIRWTLAKEHVHPCQCEDYAAHVDKEVKAYIDEHNLNINPEGVFFVDDLPNPPHPNCQCEFDLIDDTGHEEVIPSHGRRVLSRIRGLVRKLLGS